MFKVGRGEKFEGVRPHARACVAEPGAPGHREPARAQTSGEAIVDHNPATEHGSRGVVVRSLTPAHHGGEPTDGARLSVDVHHKDMTRKRREQIATAPQMDSIVSRCARFMVSSGVG